MVDLRKFRYSIYSKFSWLNRCLDRIDAWLQAYMKPIAHIMRRLWQTRVSTASMLIGCFLLSVTQARDLFTDRTVTTGRQVLFCLLLVLFWAIPVHYAARLAIDEASSPDESHSVSSRFARWFDRAWPRVLGISIIVIVAYNARCAQYALESIGGLGEARKGSERITVLLLLLFPTAAAFIVYALLHRWGVKKVRGRARPGGAALFDVMWIALPWFLASLTIGFFIWAVAWPFPFANQLPRLLLIPVILGGWIPIAGYLAKVSSKIGVPVLGIGIAAMLAGGLLSDHKHDIRVYTASKAPHVEKRPNRQSALSSAIVHWKKANGCDGADVKCPPAILVAAEGGASRAAFHVATVLGALLDETSKNTHHSAASAIFAMSGVSGGALGVGVLRAALQDSKDGAPPCKHGDPEKLWYKSDSDSQNHKNMSWRDCLQILTSGDYLSPVFVGATFRDWLSIPNLGAVGRDVKADRSAILEQAIERHYNRVVFGTGEDSLACSEGTDSQRSELEGRGLCRPFGYLDHTEQRWMPLLFLNATTVESGRQLITSDIYLSCPASAPRKHFFDLFPAALDLFEILESKQVKDPVASGATTDPTCAPRDAIENTDVLMSTAIVSSARFPLVSTEGNLRNLDGEVATRIVDGGYFDNSGLVTLQVLAAELQHFHVRPIIFYISNDPWSSDPAKLSLPGRDSSTAPTVVPDNEFWSRLGYIIGSPLLTLNHTRAGHAELARFHAYQMVAETGASDTRGYLTVRVYQSIQNHRSDGNGMNPISMPAVSMSWWLSPVVQEYLDLQLNDVNNRVHFKCLLNQLARQSPGAVEESAACRQAAPPPGSILHFY